MFLMHSQIQWLIYLIMGLQSCVTTPWWHYPECHMLNQTFVKVLWFTKTEKKKKTKILTKSELQTI